MTLPADLTRLFDADYRLNARETERLARDALHNHRDQLDYRDAPHNPGTPPPPNTTERIMDALKLGELQQLRAERKLLVELAEAAVGFYIATSEMSFMIGTESTDLQSAVVAYMERTGRRQAEVEYERREP